MFCNKELKMPKPSKICLRATLAAGALVLAPAFVQADDAPPLDEFTELAFEVVDIGFCFMPDIPDDDLRAIIAEMQGQTPLQGAATAPAEMPLYGEGYFTRGNDGAAIAASMVATMVPDEGEITQLCLVLLPLDSPEGLAGSFDLTGFSSLDDMDTPAPGYVLLGQHIGRNAEGGDQRLGDLEQLSGTVAFNGDDGEFLQVALDFEGALDDGTPVSANLEVSLMTADELRFMYLNTP